MNLPTGTLLQGGKYKIVRFISSGGFGCTYEAEHVMLHKRMAIKEFFVKDFCNRDETTAHVTVGTTSKRGLVDKLKKKFIDEAIAISALEHTNIVRVSDVFEENGTAYYVMDYIDGMSLHDMLKQRGKLPEVEALKYIRQVANALKYVHKQNRLHLDVKPSNIMVDSHDNAILIDFGTSKQYDEADGENTSTLMGKTPGYAPIEQMGNDVVRFTPATDIYALGATLYKLLTGVTPLGANLLASGEALAPLPSNISRNVANAISSAMKINKTQRPQDIDKFLTILNDVGSGNIDEGEETIFDAKPLKDPPRPIGQKPIKPTPHPVGGDKKFPFKTICLVLCFAVVTALIGWWISKSKVIVPPGESISETKVTTPETKSDKPTDVTDAKMTYKGTTFTYTGPVNAEGNPNGEGVGVYSDKNNNGTYQGNYVNGCREGKGTFATPGNKNKFEGTYMNDQYYEGRLTFEDGSYFEGTFNNNKCDTGTMYNADGSIDGEMKNGDWK